MLAKGGSPQASTVVKQKGTRLHPASLGSAGSLKASPPQYYPVTAGLLFSLLSSNWHLKSNTSPLIFLPPVNLIFQYRVEECGWAVGGGVGSKVSQHLTCRCFPREHRAFFGMFVTTNEPIMSWAWSLQLLIPALGGLCQEDWPKCLVRLTAVWSRTRLSQRADTKRMAVYESLTWYLSFPVKSSSGGHTGPCVVLTCPWVLLSCCLSLVLQTFLFMPTLAVLRNASQGFCGMFYWDWPDTDPMLSH